MRTNKVEIIIAKWQEQFLQENPSALKNGYNAMHILEWLAKKEKK
jgi:hypothetical protein